MAEGEANNTIETDADRLAVAMDPLIYHTPPLPLQNATGVVAACCLIVSTWIVFIFIFTVSLINIKRMNDYEYELGVQWNESILILSIIFAVFSSILYYLLYKGYVKPFCFTLCIIIDALFGVFAVIVLIYWLRWRPAECFSADSVVWMKESQFSNESSKILLRDLQIDDYVLNVDPITNTIFWEQVLVRVHYEWFDGKDKYVWMRKFYLENNITITMSRDHFIFINDIIKPTVILAESVQVGDLLYYYGYDEECVSLIKVMKIEENVYKQKRVFFTMSQYVLVNNVVASPFAGPHPIYHTILHKLFVSNIILIRYVWPQYMSSLFAFIAIFLMYSAHFIFVHCFPFCVLIVAIFFVLYKNVYHDGATNKIKKQ